MDKRYTRHRVIEAAIMERKGKERQAGKRRDATRRDATTPHLSLFISSCIIFSWSWRAVSVSVTSPG